MMISSSFSSSLLLPAGRALLLGTFGVSLFQVIRGRDELSLPFERLVVAFIAMLTFEIYADWLSAVSEGLSASILALSHQGDLKHQLLDAFTQAAKAPSGAGSDTTFNIPSVLEQAWRTGVWGVMSAFVQGVFLIVDFVLSCAKDVLWSLLLLLFPLAAGVFPVFPRIMTNLCVYAVELSLWHPILCLVELISGVVAQKRLTEAGSWGLYLVAVELVAILLILMIPTVTHRFLSGAFSGDFESHSGLIAWGKNVAFAARPAPGGPQ